MSEAIAKRAGSESGFARGAAGPGREIYYGWVMLPLSMATLIASSPGQTFGVSVFNEPIRVSLGLSYGQLATAYMLGTLLGAIPIGYLGRQADRHGLRRSLLVVITLFSAACVFLSFVQGWGTLVIAFCLLRALGPGALGLLSGNTLAFWFERRLGMVEGIRQVGMALAMATVPALNLWLVSRWGWRGAYEILGIGIWLLLFPLIFFLFRNTPADVGQRVDGIAPVERRDPSHGDKSGEFWGLTLSETLQTWAFWIAAVGTSLFGLIHTAVFFCLVPILQERGLTAADAAATLTVFAVCLALMQLIGGMLADWVRAAYLMCAGLLGLGAGTLALLLADTPTSAALAGALFGISQGTYFGATQPLWARYFGRRHLGKIRGVLMTMIVGSSSLGPLIAGLTRDWTGGFDISLIAFAVTPLPVAALSLLAAPPLARGPHLKTTNSNTNR